MILDSFLLLTSPTNFLLYQDLASQFRFHESLTKILEAHNLDKTQILEDQTSV